MKSDQDKFKIKQFPIKNLFECIKNVFKNISFVFFLNDVTIKC